MLTQDSSRSLCVSLVLAPHHGVRRHLVHGTASRPRTRPHQSCLALLSLIVALLRNVGTTVTADGNPLRNAGYQDPTVSLPRLAASSRRVFLPSCLGVSLSCLVASYAIVSLSSVAVLRCDCFLAVLSRCECFLFILSYSLSCLAASLSCLTASLSRLTVACVVSSRCPVCCLFLLSFLVVFLVVLLVAFLVVFYGV